MYKLALFLILAELSLPSGHQNIKRNKINGFNKKNFQENILNSSKETFKEFFEASAQNIHNQSCTALTTNLPACRDYLDYFLARNEAATIALALYQNISSLSHYIIKTRYFFIFIKSPSEINSNLLSTARYILWNKRSFIYFVICDPVYSIHWLQEAFNEIWNHHLLDHIIAFSSNQILRLHSYNPFNNTILTPSPTKLFPDKLNNLNGFELKISVNHDPPRTEKRGTEYIGSSVTLFKNFAHHLNANLIFIPTFNDTTLATREDVLGGKTDFSDLSLYLVPGFPGDFSYPILTDDVVALVPKAKQIPQYLKMTHSRAAIQWRRSIMATIVVSIFYFKFFSSKNFIKSYLEILGIFVNQPLCRFRERRPKAKAFLMSWILLTIVMNCSFQTSLINSILNQEYYPSIENVAQLQESNLQVCLSSAFPRYVKNQLPLQSKIVEMAAKTLRQRIREKDTSCAYVSSVSYVLMLFHSNSSLGLTFNVMKERLANALSVYIFHPHSPYLEVFNRFNMLYFEFSLSSYMGLYADKKQSGSVRGYTNNRDVRRSILSLKHMAAFFRFLVYSWVASILLLIVEIVWKKLNLSKLNAVFKINIL